MSKLMAAAVAATAAAGVAVAVPATATAADGCSTRWGSLPKSAAATAPNEFLAVRTGPHACFDRLVIDVSGKGTGWMVRYGTVHNQGEGRALPLRGAADIEIVAQAGATRGIPMPGVAGYRTFRQVAWGGSFEGYTTIGLGVRARLPMRAYSVTGPGTHARIVVDVAHHW